MAQFTHYRVHPDRQIPEIGSEVVHIDKSTSFIEKLSASLKILITRLDEESIEFDLIGIDASIANALRRIMLAEVPTIAVEHVWIAINSSIVQDEMLAHRIGLIPIRADPSKLDYVVGDEETDRDTIVFHYDVECKSETVTKPNGQTAFVNESALSGSLSWLPQGSQAEVFLDAVKPVHEDIVIAKLRPGQRIEFEAHCRKGVGKDHTKFSPVATASYRLLPEISFLQPVVGAQAVELKTMCPMQVFDIEDSVAVVARPRDCTMCRECIRHEGWTEKVKLARKNDHFLFSVESTGVLAPETIVREGIRIFKEKAVKFQGLVDEYAENN